jgi:hypothetical protein
VPRANRPEFTAVPREYYLKRTAGERGSCPAKKVLTNDDLHVRRSDISVVGDKRDQSYHRSPAQPAYPATVSWIRKSLEKLNAELDETNRKLASLKKFEAGDEVKDPGRQIDKGLNRTPPDQQIKQLEASKKKLEAEIGDLLDKARKKGIDAGQLR